MSDIKDQNSFSSRRQFLSDFINNNPFITEDEKIEESQETVKLLSVESVRGA